MDNIEQIRDEISKRKSQNKPYNGYKLRLGALLIQKEKNYEEALQLWHEVAQSNTENGGYASYNLLAMYCGAFAESHEIERVRAMLFREFGISSTSSDMNSKDFVKLLEKLASYKDGWSMIILGTLYCGSYHPFIKQTFGEEAFSPNKNVKAGHKLIDEGIKIAQGNSYELKYHDYSIIVDAYRAPVDAAPLADIGRLELAKEYSAKARDAVQKDEANRIELINSWNNRIETFEKQIASQKSAMGATERILIVRDEPRFNELIEKAQTLIEKHAPVNSDDDVLKVEEAIKYIEEALTLSVSEERRMHCQTALKEYKGALTAGKDKLKYRKAGAAYQEMVDKIEERLPELRESDNQQQNNKSSKKIVGALIILAVIGALGFFYHATFGLPFLNREYATSPEDVVQTASQETQPMANPAEEFIGQFVGERTPQYIVSAHEVIFLDGIDKPIIAIYYAPTGEHAWGRPSELYLYFEGSYIMVRQFYGFLRFYRNSSGDIVMSSSNPDPGAGIFVYDVEFDGLRLWLNRRGSMDDHYSPPIVSGMTGEWTQIIPYIGEYLDGWMNQ